MNKEIKKQLILSGTLLCVLLLTLILWYNNFLFHTYADVASYQYCFSGENDDFMVEGYEFYQSDSVAKHGNERLLALKDQLILKGDTIQTTLSFQNQKNKTLTYQQEYKVSTDNEACFFLEDETKESLYNDEFHQIQMQIQVMRDDKKVYDETIHMKQNHIVAYNGSNKDYSIQNVYISSSWLKTGTFSSTIKGIAKKYPYMSIDYLYAKDNTTTVDINHLERFVLLKGKTEDMLSNKIQQTAYYDEKGSLLDKPIYCVITLDKDDQFQNPYTFMIELHGTIKVVNPDA